MKPPTNNTPPQGYKMTELGALPEEWEVVRLGDLSKKDSIKIQFGFPCAKWNDKEIGIAQLRPFNITESGGTDLTALKYIESDKADVSKYLVQKEDIIFNNTNSEELVGKTTYWKYENCKYVLSNHMTIVRIVDKNKINAYFLAKYLHKRWADGFYRTVCRRHVNQSSISLARLNQIQIPLPPLPEQQKIASVLSAVQEAKEKTEAVITAAKALKKSMMKHLFTYGPVSPQEAENVLLKETEIGFGPEDWEVVRLGEVVRAKITDGTHKTPKYIKTGIPFITITNLVNGQIDFSKSKFISKEEHNSLIKRCMPEKDDVLLSKVGTLGLTAKVNVNSDFSIFVQLALIKPKKEIINSEYLKHLLSSTQMQNQINAKASQSTMKYIGVEKIANLKIPLPPLPIQQKIASILSAIDAKIEAEENKKKALEELFKTLLDYLMTAKIRMNHLEVPS
jgi:type I restriction enzyme S subunit